MLTTTEMLTTEILIDYIMLTTTEMLTTEILIDYITT
jgi:hypothetical protein